MTYLSVLDQSPIRGGVTPAAAVAETVRLAEFADRLGYRRYWLAEHHGSNGLAGSSPEILITRVASNTKRSVKSRTTSFEGGLSPAPLTATNRM